ncbi:hypothetical protein EYF80_031479 [Liparis tanakae]|uniref:Uncharacterized protein n=1 Tax=Liparis tanakae TaxID=230148 RepID=A0A4Z2GXP6_9TELE|nr:hypothetical protein EYF80_031479 [Liparis tanakae]
MAGQLRFECRGPRAGIIRTCFGRVVGVDLTDGTALFRGPAVQLLGCHQQPGVLDQSWSEVVVRVDFGDQTRPVVEMDPELLAQWLTLEMYAAARRALLVYSCMKSSRDRCSSSLHRAV